MSPDYMIRCHMERVGGVVHYDQVTPTRAEYATGRGWLMAELRADAGLRQGGAGRIVVYDMHFFGRNVELDSLPGGLEVLCGKPPYRLDARTVRLTGPGATAVWAAYWETKLVCQREAGRSLQ